MPMWPSCSLYSVALWLVDGTPHAMILQNGRTVSWLCSTVDAIAGLLVQCRPLLRLKELNWNQTTHALSLFVNVVAVGFGDWDLPNPTATATGSQGQSCLAIPCPRHVQSYCLIHVCMNRQLGRSLSANDLELGVQCKYHHPSMTKKNSNIMHVCLINH